MISLVHSDNDYVKNWIIERIDSLDSLSTCVTIGVVSDGRLIAGVAYHDYHVRYDHIQISMVAISPMWARKHIIKQLLGYPFEQLNCYKVGLHVEVGNEKALRTIKKLGFTREAILSHSYGKGKHAVLLRMLKPYYIHKYGSSHG